MNFIITLKLSLLISAFLTWSPSTAGDPVSVTYFEIDEDFASTGEYNVCPSINFHISTCQNIYPKSVSVCRGDGGYQRDLVGPPTIQDHNVTICCSSPGATDFSPNINATEFGNYLQDRNIEVLTTIGCDFTGGTNDFLQLQSFREIEVKSPKGVVQFTITASDQITQDWVNDVAEGSTDSDSNNSHLSIDPELFSYRKTDSAKIIKSFSYVDKNGKMTTVTYAGT